MPWFFSHLFTFMTLTRERNLQDVPSALTGTFLGLSECM